MQTVGFFGMRTKVYQARTKGYLFSIVFINRGTVHYWWVSYFLVPWSH